jgi:hypothetical protein
MLEQPSDHLRERLEKRQEARHLADDGLLSRPAPPYICTQAG